MPTATQVCIVADFFCKSTLKISILTKKKGGHSLVVDIPKLATFSLRFALFYHLLNVAPDLFSRFSGVISKQVRRMVSRHYRNRVEPTPVATEACDA